ncbi:MAG: DUF4082 domain-containing protein [Propioniciclava sp.]|uniref:DUF4082 domain-containing protein n=1 Tax=Propioniciclava sp. TaxID=2038686 RepID=UPI0039E38328
MFDSMHPRPSKRRSSRPLVTVLAVALAFASAIVTGLTAAAAAPCEDGGNAIVCENAKPGVHADVWDISGVGDHSIQGYSTEISVDAGHRIDFKIDTDATDYRIDIYRTGYYQGLGARLWGSVRPDVSLPQNQPECLNDLSTELYDCGAWAVSAHWDVPANAVSGVYVAKLIRTDTGGSSHITFVVRDDGSTADMVLQTSDTTWHAYNTYGGSDFYQGAINGRAYKVSYNRPFATRGGIEERDFYFGAEYPMVRFLEQNGYDVTYIAGVDTDRSGERLLNHKTFISIGHDEYWSGRQRANVEAARDAGVNLAFFSGNEMYWRGRWEPSVAGTPTDYRTFVSYKETFNHRKIDPSTEWTGTFRDPRFSNQADGGGVPENALTGTMYMVNYSDLPVTVNDEEGKLRLWRNTGLDAQAPGTSTALTPHTVGYESDEDIDNGFRPAGLIRMSTTKGMVSEYLQDFGSVVAPGETTHHITLYRATSGALVFSAGSVQWSWGLDSMHDGERPAADVRMRQATLNLFADMGVQPATLADDLVAATRTTDAAAPTATITAPAAGTSLASGSAVTVTGTAADVGGKVAGVEVSLDGGRTWHPAEGRQNWSYTGLINGIGAGSIRARAIDDSVNLGAPAEVAVTVAGPTSIYGQQVPDRPSTADPGALELGLRFTPSVDGYVQGVRFYKGPANTGPHVGRLWSATGQQLASVTFTDETATGWQVARFSRPVAVSAGQKLVVSYTAPAGGYAASEDVFYYDGIDTGVLTVSGGFGSEVASVFSAPGQFPDRSYGRPSYFVDVQFSTVDDSPLTAFGHAPADRAVSVAPASTVSVTLSRNVDPASVAMTLVDSADRAVEGTTSYDAPTRTATFTPASPLAAFVEFRASVTATTTGDGQPIAEGGTWSFRTQRPDSDACPCGLFAESEVPGMADANDGRPLTVATRFIASNAGEVSGVEYYKGAADNGDVTVFLWGPDHAVLASAPVTDQVAAGWQRVLFDTPVVIAEGAEYTVGYRTSAGVYPVTLGRLSTPVTAGLLRTPEKAGGFTYGTGYPDAQVSTSYLVDVLYTPVEAAPSVLSLTPSRGAIDVPASSQLTVKVSAPLAPGATLTLVDALDHAVEGTTSTSADGRTVTFVPKRPLGESATYHAAFTGQRAEDGAAFPATEWSFTTAAPPGQCPCTGFGSVTPQGVDSNDGAATELGMTFIPERDGWITGVRFYKSAANTGTHTGSLWDGGGNRLATTTFSNETQSGWQTASFDNPVAVVKGRTYVVSYLAPQGHYSADAAYFTAERAVGPFRTPAGAGRYVYGGGFPVFSWNGTNYYVDAVFTEGELSVVDQAPAQGETGVDRFATVSARLSQLPVGSTPQIALTAANQPVAGTSSFDSGTQSVTFTPAGQLAELTTFTATVTLAGETLASWTFTTGQTRVYTDLQSLWSDADTPAVPSWDDSAAIQVGTRVRVEVDGTVAGVRFYKGAGNTGTHTGYVWSASGQLLGSGTFTRESAEGWQTLQLGTPVEVTAGTELVVSYYAPNGHYAVTAEALARQRSVDGLTSLAPGGVFAYGSTAFPTGTSPHSFWVDLLLEPASDPGTGTEGPAPVLAGRGLWSLDDVPAVAASTDTDYVQVGTRLKVTQDGTIPGMRFYKGEGNTGTHVGNLWSIDGRLLASGTFTGETASGWQTLAFSTPVTVSAGTELVVSYVAPRGHYAFTSKGLEFPVSAGPVQSLERGGTYVYGAGFPSATSAHAYWTDIVFTPAP